MTDVKRGVMCVVWLLACVGLVGPGAGCSSNAPGQSKSGSHAGADVGIGADSGGGQGDTSSAPICKDGVKDGAETDVDCGGPYCAHCAVHEHCTASSDCSTGVCGPQGTCIQPSCTDTVKDGAETDVDCGGGHCPTCASGKHCSKSADCASDICAFDGVCAKASCDDGVKNGSESDVDCGGTDCNKCALRKACRDDADCTTGFCYQRVCTQPTCNDGLQNQGESDVDCGGKQCPACGAGQSCRIPEDCQSKHCAQGKCQPATCSDGVKDGDESDVDCGGSKCGACKAGKGCQSNSDCKTGYCASNKCATSLTDDYNNENLIDPATSGQYQVDHSVAHLGYTFNIDTGTGADGAVTIGMANINTDVIKPGRTRPDGEAFAVQSINADKITVTGTGTGGTPANTLAQSISTGDEVIVINMQGSPTKHAHVGVYEFCHVNFVLTATITCTHPLQKTFGETDNSDLSDQKIMVQRVPNYTDVTMGPNSTLTANAWNGTTGGLLIFRASGTVANKGVITMSAKGYRGGAQAAGQQPGSQGESYAGPGTTATAKNFGGGGGGRGVWDFGGNGGYATAGDQGTDTGNDPGGFGLGGDAYGHTPLQRLWLGSGGGAGGSQSNPPQGGAGGGIVYISANKLTTKKILSLGSVGAPNVYANGGGGGAGGTIFLTADDLSSQELNTTGGPAAFSHHASNGRITIYYYTSYAHQKVVGDLYTEQRIRYPNAVVQSKNLLDGQTASAIVGFGYNLVSLPTGTSVVVQFSQDATTWYNAAGVAGQSDALQVGSQHILDLSALGWSGAHFFYRMIFNSTGKDTPKIDSVTLYYTP